MMFLGNLLFAGVLGKSTGNANLAALIQKNIAERVDPSSAHKTEHAGISTRALTVRSLKFDFKLTHYTPDMKKIPEMVKKLVKKDKSVEYVWMLMAVLLPVNLISTLIWRSVFFFTVAPPALMGKVFGYVGLYDFTPGFLIMLTVIAVFLSNPPTYSVDYWAQWAGYIAGASLIVNLLAKFLPGRVFPNSGVALANGGVNPDKQYAEILKSIIMILGVLGDACAYYFLVGLPMMQTLLSFVK